MTRDKLADQMQGNSELIVCEWCGHVTHLVWRNGAGFCGSCKRELEPGEEPEE